MRRILLLVMLATLVFLNWNPPAMEQRERVLRFHAFLNPADLEAFQQAAESFRARHGITVELINYSIDIFKERMDFLAHRQPPDLVLMPNDWLGRFAAAGQLTQLPGWLLEDYTFDEACRDAGRVEGGLYGIPLFVETPLLIYNPLLQPSPPDSFRGLVQQVESQPERTESVLLFDIHSPYILSYFIHQCGGILQPGRPVQTREAVAGIIQAAGMARKIPQMADMSMDYAVMLNLFQQGKAAMMIDGPWSFPSLKNTGIPFQAVPLPLDPDRSGPFFSVRCLAIPRGAPRESESLLFIRHLLAKSTLQEFVLKANLIPARSLPSGNLSEQTRHILKNLSKSVPLPGHAGMADFWHEITTMVETLLSPAERSDPLETTQAQ